MAIINPNSISREEYLRRKRKKKLLKYYVFIFLFILSISLLSFLSYRKNLRIHEVSLVGGVLVTEKDIREETERFLDGSYFLLFPKDNAFIYPKGKLEKDLSEKFKRIETIDISREGLNKLKITITERKPIAIWCTEGKVIGTTTPQDSFPKEDCYFIDQNSTIFATAPNFSGNVYFKYYGLVESRDPIGQKYIASTTVFTAINNFITDIKRIGLKPAYLKSMGEDEFSVVLLSGGQIYFDTKKSLENAIGNLSTLVNSVEFKNYSVSNIPVDYIDLRYGNKLFYKLKTQ